MILLAVFVLGVLFLAGKGTRLRTKFWGMVLAGALVLAYQHFGARLLAGQPVPHPLEWLDQAMEHVRSAVP